MVQHIDNKRERAKKRVEEIKSFFRHLKIFVIVNGLLFLLKVGWLQSFLPDWFPEETYYFEWVVANILIWGLILAVHALTLYRHKITFLKGWEERKIRQYMEKDHSESKKYK